MFRVEAMIRPQGTDMDYRKAGIDSYNNDKQHHMHILQDLGFEVLSIKISSVAEVISPDDAQGNMSHVNTHDVISSEANPEVVETDENSDPNTNTGSD